MISSESLGFGLIHALRAALPRSRGFSSFQHFQTNGKNLPLSLLRGAEPQLFVHVPRLLSLQPQPSPPSKDEYHRRKISERDERRVWISCQQQAKMGEQARSCRGDYSRDQRPHIYNVDRDHHEEEW